MIPNRYHFVFGLKKQTEPFHLIYYLCLASCLRVNRPEAIYFYYHYEPFGRYWDLIKEELILVPVQPVDFPGKYRYSSHYLRRFRYAHQTDFIRLEKLTAHGGIYSDIDTIFVSPVPQRLREEAFVLGRRADAFDAEGNEIPDSICNAFMMAERNAPFGRIWSEQLRGAFDGASSDHSTLLPGRLARQNPELIHLEPSRTFYKHGGTPEGLRTLLEGCDPDYEGVISMHLWSHLWWSRRRRDFSEFHAGRLSEDFVRNVDTTYNLVARRFLPPIQTRRKQMWGWMSRGLARMHQGSAGVCELGTRAYLLARLGAFTVLPRRIPPNSPIRLERARRQWEHSYIRKRIRPRNQFERTAIVETVTVWDEYGMAGWRLAPSDVVIDIGAHVGAFTLLCHHLGSRRVHAYEPERENFGLLARHSRRLDGINLFHLGVFRSDVARDCTLIHSGYLGDNTGAGNVLLHGLLWDVDRQVLVDETSHSKQMVQTVSLDDVLEKFERVRLLKLDCEGSEFPILLTSRLLARIDVITGEFHEIRPEIYAALDPVARMEGFAEYRVEVLVTHLEQFGFDVEVRQTGPHIGLFNAVQRQHKPQTHMGERMGRARDSADLQELANRAGAEPGAI